MATAKKTAKKPTKPARALSEYKAKRNFKATPEPGPKKEATKKGRSFCVQMHLASRLHYDFRLEHNGVLLSWSVPKGPSLNAADKRLAVQVEDHPVAYGDFEGVIPSGYGAGVVVLWDRGTWAPENGDVSAALQKGELKFSLDGVKLKGSWVLVRTRRDEGGKPQWLLIKHRDQWSGEIDVTQAAPDSVKSFQDMSGVLRDAGVPEAWKRELPMKSGEAAEKMRAVVKGALAGGTTKPKDDMTWESHKPGERAINAAKGKKVTTKKGQHRALPAAKVPASALKLGKNQPKLSNLTKVLFPATKFTKGDLIEYYTAVAPLILPHLAKRAATLKRYPDGVDGKFFFEKRCASHRPEWMETAKVDAGGEAGPVEYCVIGDVPSLMWAANMAAIEIHVPLAMAAAPEVPRSMVFDLDPGAPADISDCARVALRLRDLLKSQGLECFAKHSGSKGIHVFVPLNRTGVTFEATKSYARAVAQALEKDDPKRVISKMDRAAREGKVYVDWAQNDSAKTTAPPYIVRAREKPWVSVPLDWEAIEAGRPTAPTADQFLKKLPKADAFADVLSRAQALPR